jgi:histidinol-phosphate aminotransferase
MREARAMALARVARHNLTVLPTNANMFMIDWKTRPAREMQKAFAGQSVAIGRSWPIWPTVSRVTVGSMDDMTGFCRALDTIMA